jgi:hypothetical protein
MTVKALRVEAEKLGIKRVSALKKDELVSAILAASASAAKAKAENSVGKKAAVKTSDKAAGKTADKAADKAADETAGKKDEDKSASKAAADKKSSKKSAALKNASDKKSLEDAEDEDEETEAPEDAEAKAEEKVEEPAPVEPDSVFIDHGAILPEFIPGTCLFALVRDPGTIFVYWNAEFESENGWLLTAYDRNNNILQQFSTPTKRNGRGYFRVPSSLVARVTLAEIHRDGRSDVKLESKVRIAEQMGLVQPRAYDERWIDIKSHEVVFEAPAPGYAPQASEVAQRMIAPAITGGGYDRSVESLDHPFGCSSSRFGSVGAPGSSDIFYPGSSDLNLKRRK